MGESLEPILDLYAAQYGVVFAARLGEGKDGEVYRTTSMTAVKFLSSMDYFNRERRAYKILQEAKIVRIAGHQCPTLIRTDDVYLSIEMTVVRPPFIVDFVSAYTDEELEWLGFSEDVIAERHAFWQERFGERWPKVMQICGEFHRVTGLTLLDLSHNNIRFT
jgi:hypothetical protein